MEKCEQAVWFLGRRKNKVTEQRTSDLNKTRDKIQMDKNVCEFLRKICIKPWKCLIFELDR